MQSITANTVQTAQTLAKKNVQAATSMIERFEVHCRGRQWSPNTCVIYRRSAEMLEKYLNLAHLSISTMTQADWGAFLYWLEFPTWTPGTPAVTVSPADEREVATVRTYASGAQEYARFQRRAGVAVPWLAEADGGAREAAAAAGLRQPLNGQWSLVPKGTKRRPMVVPVAVYGKLRDLAESLSLRDCALLQLLFFTGLRIGEALGLRLEDLDLREGLVQVVHRSDNPNHALAKDGYGRSVPMEETTIAALNRYIDSDEYTDAAEHAAPGHRGYVFMTRRRGRAYAKALSYNASYKMMCALFARAQKLAEDPVPADARRVTPHMLRHTYATQMVERDAKPEEIRVALGHQSIRTTLDTYVESSTSKVAEHLRSIARDRASAVDMKGARHEPRRTSAR